MKRKLLLLIIIIFAVTVFVDSRTGIFYGPPAQTGRIIWHGNPGMNQIALTFDDGPSWKYTAKVLNILKKYNVKATFFVVGEHIKPNKKLIARMNKEGHSIGNHTYYHIDGRVVKQKKIWNNIYYTSVLIKRMTGKKAAYFRPTYGYVNWRFLKEAEKLDLQTILWSIDAGEWNGKISKENIINRVVSNTRNGSIILLHDGGSSKEAVIAALPVIIKKLKSKGFEFVTIPEMMNNLDQNIIFSGKPPDIVSQLKNGKYFKNF
ncbi:polysaccharide deacetylase family protein [Candidatus Margulisiibacteriota bacterium]